MMFIDARRWPSNSNANAYNCHAQTESSVQTDPARRAIPDGKPNIVFILTDDQAVWGVGCYGNPEIRTPHIDALADGGARIQNFYTSTPVCSASRATYLTGKINSQHGVHDWIRRDPAGDMAGSFLDGQVTYADALAANGWSCGLFGKWHLGEQELADHGFDYHFFRLYGGGDYNDAPFIRNGVREETTGYVSDVITDDAIDWISARAAEGDPFYASVHYTAPHSPWYGHPQDIVNSYADCPFESCPQEEPHPWMTGSPTEFKGGKQMLQGYFAAVTAMDACVGRIVAHLDELKIREDTFIVFVSDNGFNFGHHGVWGKGNGTFPFNMYENSVKVPGIFNQPGTVESGRVFEGLYSSYDVMPTLMDHAGLPLPAGVKLPGRSFRATLRGDAEESRDRVVVFDEFGGTRMIRTPRWKYIHRYDIGPNQLFDMVNDPDERTDLATDPDYAGRITSMRGLLEDWFDAHTVSDRDGRKFGVTGFGQISRLNGDLEADRKRFARSWSDPRAF